MNLFTTNKKDNYLWKHCFPFLLTERIKSNDSDDNNENDNNNNGNNDISNSCNNNDTCNNNGIYK